jgi:hypothetical protein
MKKSLKTKKCRHCEIEFYSKYKNICCSDKCKEYYEKLKYENHKESLRKKKIEENKSLTDAVKCAMCEMKSHDLCSHISRTHKMSIEEYKIKFPNNPIHSNSQLQKLSENIKGDKNPGYQHGGKLSPFSKKFINADKIDRKKLYQKVSKSRIDNNNDNTKIEYYTSRGFSEDGAKIELSKRQSTFSKQSCIDKYGKQKGLEVWSKRQEKWLSSLNSKSEDEIKAINRKKASPGCNISKAEYEILKELKNNNFDIHHQFCISSEKGYIYDFRMENKIIEYYGDYWHCNPKIYKNDYENKRLKMTAKEKWIADKEKELFAEKNNYQLMVVWESDYKENPEKIIKECIKFLNE